MLPQNDDEKDAGTKGRRKKCGKIEVCSDELGLTLSRQVLRLCRFWLHPKVRGYAQLQGNLKAGWEEIRNPTQRRVLKWSCKMHTLAGWWAQPRWNLSLQKVNQVMWIFPNLKPGACMKRKWLGDRLLTKQLRGNLEHPANQKTRKILKLKEKTGHTICTCFQLQSLTEKQSSRSSEKSANERARGPNGGSGRERGYWIIFLNTTLQAAVHLGQDYEVNLRFVKNHLWKSLEQLCNETERLIRDQTEIIGMKKIVFKELTWRSTSLLCSRAYLITNAKTYHILRLCALCGREKCEMILNGIRKTITSRNLNRIDGMQTEFEWKIFPGITPLGPPREDSRSDERPTVGTWAVQRQDHLHVNVQRHCMERKRKHWKVCWEFYYNCEVRSQIPSRPLVFLGTWIRKEMVRDLFW